MVSRAVRARYEKEADVYDLLVEVVKYRTPTVVATHLVGLLPANPRVLDCGCGTGKNADAHSGGHFTGVDAALGMLRVARTRGYHVVQADLRSLPFATEVFDAVLCTAVLDHYPRINNPVREMARVACHNGVLAFTTICDRQMRSHVALSTVRTALERNDLRLVETFHYLSHQLPGYAPIRYRLTIAQKS